MKYIIRLLLASVCLSVGLTSCYDDKGNYDYTVLPSLNIETKDAIYVTQFTTLELPVEIELLDNADEKDYDFSWRIWSNDILGVYNQKKDICLTKDLKYEVTEMPGTYTLTLTCHNRKTGVNSYKSVNMTVQGIITEGWMVLHEKDGITDFDLIMSPYFSDRVSEDKIISNVYESINHEKLKGRGVKISSFFSIGRYQDVVVLTDGGGARLDAATMQKTYDMSTLSMLMDNYKPENYLYYNYYWGPNRDGFDAIISDGRYYLYSVIPSIGFNFYTEPIKRDGLTYKASSYAPRLIQYYKGMVYDEEHDRFIGVMNDGSYCFTELPENTFSGTHFTANDIKGTLRFMGTGFNDYEYGLFEDRQTHEHTLLVFDFLHTVNSDKGKYVANACPELKDAKFFDTGLLGPIFYYATEKDIYLYDYQGSNSARKVYSLSNPAEKLTCMKLYKPCVHRYVPIHKYNCSVLILSTYNESTKEGKIYMYNTNVVNGVIDVSSEKVFGGYGEILDMEYNIPKYGI